MEALWQDIKYGVRLLGKNPGFTLIVVLTLALGVGANTAIFSVLNSVLLRTLPVNHPEQLVSLTDPDGHGGWFGSQMGERSLLAYSEFEYLRDHNEVLSRVFAADSDLPDVEATVGDVSTTGAGEVQNVRVKLVSGDYFTTLGVQPAAGHLFSTSVDRARGAAPVAVVSYDFWKQRFGLRPEILGKAVSIHHTSFEIVGIAPPGFSGETVGEAPDLWVPMMMQDAVYPNRDLLSPSTQGVLNQHMWLAVMGRLKPGVSVAQANASLNVSFKRLLESTAGSSLSFKDSKNYLDERLKVQLASRGASTLRAAFGGPLKYLMVLVGLVLLISCANVANLMLARGTARQKEFAMRAAIGAGRGRLIRQLLTESVLLALLGATAGLLLAHWADYLLLHMVSGTTRAAAVQLNLQPDARMLAFTLGITVLTALLFGLIPSLSATRRNLTWAINSRVANLAGPSFAKRLSAGKMLAITQVAVSLILLVAASLFVRSLSRLHQVSLGYERENLLLFRVNATAGGYKGAAATHLYQELQQRFAAVPGLRGVTVSNNGLFSGSESGDPIFVEGYAPKQGEEMDAAMDHVGPHYFSTVGIPILLGREIEEQDSANSLRPAVINQTFAKRFFAASNPIGKRVRDTYPGNPADMVVVGVVADAKYRNLREKTPPRIYAPLFNPMWEMNSAVFEVRTLADPASVSALLRQAAQAASSSLPPIEIRTMSGLVDDTLQTDRFIELLSEAFGGLALLLASVGLYGVMAYTVARRTREMGIRLALGAIPSGVLWQVLRETLALVFVGVLIGLPVAIAATQLVRSMLFGLELVDPVALAFASVVLVAVAALAGLVPALRASRVDPMVALRYE